MPMAQQPSPTLHPRISCFWPLRKTYYGWAVLSAGVLSSFATVPTQGPVMGIFVQPIRDDLEWSATAISFGFVLGSVSGGFFSWAIGGLLDRKGSRAVMSVSGLLIALTMVGLASMQQPWHFWIAFGLARGIATSGAQLATMVSLASWFVRRRGRVVGLIGVGQRFGQTVLPLCLVAIIDVLSWRAAWLVLGGMVVLLLTVPSALLVRRRPEDYGLLPDGERAEEETPEGISARAEQIENTWTLSEAKRTRTLWLLIAAQGGVVLGLNATNLFMAASLQDGGLSLALAATATTIFAGAASLSAVPWGLLLERVHTRYLGMASTAMLAIALMIAPVASSFPVAVGFALLYGLAVGAWTVTSRMLFANYFGRRYFGSIRGFAAPFMVLVNPLGPLLAGYVRDTRGSYDLAFATFSVVFMLSFIAFLLAVPPRKPTAGR